MPEDCVQRAELLAVTSDGKVNRWVREGVLQPGIQDHPSGRRGSVSFYPREALAQIGYIEAALRAKRDFDSVRIQLWWSRRWVDHRRLRQSLYAVAELAAVAEPEDVFEAAERLAVGAAAPGVRDPLMRLIRRRLNRSQEDLQTVIHALATLAHGAQPVWETPDVGLDTREPDVSDLLAAAAGVRRGAQECLAADQPWLPELPDMRELLLTMQGAGLIDLRAPARLLMEATDAQLDRARDDAIRLAEPLGTFARAAEIAYGRDAAGLGALPGLVEESETSKGRAMLVRAMLALRNIVPEQAIDEVASACDAALPAARDLIFLAGELPQYRQLLAANGPERIAALAPAARERLHADVNAALQRRAAASATSHS